MPYNDRLLLGGILLVMIGSLAFGVFGTRAMLLWVVLVGPPILVYFVWRFVRAFERIADPLERQVVEST